MADKIQFDRDHTVEYGRLETVAPGLRRITAPNPSPFTFRGTNTYVVGTGEVAVVDPGPAIPEHIDALLSELQGESVSHVLVTHTHSDHSPACALLQSRVKAPTYAAGPHGMSLREQGLSSDEGGDFDFQPDIVLSDGEILQGQDWKLECVFAPGHTSNHVCFAEPQQGYLLSGDHVMGWSTSIVSPPDGNMGDYMRSLDRLLVRDDQVYWPGHGGPVRHPLTMVNAFIAHRKAREQQVLEYLAATPATLAEMVPVIYRELDPRLFPAAERSLLACVLYLLEQQQIVVETDSAAATSSAATTDTWELLTLIQSAGTLLRPA